MLSVLATISTAAKHRRITGALEQLCLASQEVVLYTSIMWCGRLDDRSISSGCCQACVTSRLDLLCTDLHRAAASNGLPLRLLSRAGSPKKSETGTEWSARVKLNVFKQKVDCKGFGLHSTDICQPVRCP